jgi:hypothetical protein
VVVGPVRLQPSLALRTVVSSALQPSLALRTTVYSVGTGGYGVSGNSLRWRPVVTLGDVDVSARLVGDVTVDAEEGAARVAEFTLRPTGGPIDPSSWVGQSVAIDYAVLDAAGDVVTTARIFCGLVDVPEYDPSERTTRFACTDGRQQRLGRAPRAALDAMIGGYWSQHLCAAGADSLQYAEDLLSTIPASYDLDASGAGRLTPWAAAATPDHTFSASSILGGTADIRLAERGDLINTVSIDIGYRYPRELERRVRWRWSYPGGFCGWLAAGTTIPRIDMIVSAMESAGWLPMYSGLHCVHPPGSGSWCGVQWVVNDAVRQTLVLEAEAQLARRWVRDVTETYRVTVTSPESVAQVGIIDTSQSASLSADVDTSAWTGSASWADPGGDVSDANGDWYRDRTDGESGGRAEADALLEASIARARTDILSAHRTSRASWDALLHPGVDLVHTARIETDTVTAQGKVRRVVHTMRLDTGEATTSVEIAISRVTGLGLSSDPIAAPSAPDVAAELTRTDPLIRYGDTHIGGVTGCAPDDDGWVGYVGNQEPVDPGAEQYTERFVLDVPEIESAAVDPLEVETASTVDVAIPVDTLEIAV